MKKLLTVATIFISLVTTAQDLSTINILNFGLQKRDLKLMAPRMHITSGETYKMFLKFQDAFKASPNASETTVLVADTVTAQALFDLYQSIANAANYVAVATGDRVEVAIEAVNNTPLENAIAAYIVALTNDIKNSKEYGSFLLIGRRQ
jgi:hypothetical protein